MKDKNFWRCNNDEHINKVSDYDCEICGEKRPSILNCYFELTDIYGKINLFWECKNAEKVYILHKKNIIEVNLIGNIQLDEISNKEEIEIQASNNIADYTEKIIITLYKPEIVSFLSNKRKVIIGDTILLKWHTINATKVSLSKIGPIQSNGEHSIIISEKTDLTLLVENEIGKVEQTLNIYVLPPPKILTFTADKLKIIQGKTANLIWNVENADKVELELSGSVILVSNIGSNIINPNKLTIYKLIVTALDGKSIIEKYLTVEVFEEGQISFFKADRQFIFPTIPTTLSWEVNNALKVEIEGIGNFPLSGQTTVQPTVDTTYKLMVTDNFGTITRDLQIKMLPLPVIEKLLIPSPNIISESTINIALPNYTANNTVLPKVVALNKNNFKLNLNSSTFIKPPNITNFEYKIEEVSFFERLKKVITLIKKEFNNEKNRKYVIKK